VALGVAKAGLESTASEGAPRAELIAEAHVTAHDSGTDPRVCVGVPRRWKAPRVVELVSSSRRDEGSGLGKPGGWRHAKVRRRKLGSDGGVNGTARSGARRTRRCAPTRESPPKRIRRRETPGSPVSWSRVQARRPRARRKPRRDAGSSRGAGTRSQAVGSRSRSYASRSFHRGEPQGRLQEGRASSR